MKTKLMYLSFLTIIVWMWSHGLPAVAAEQTMEMGKKGEVSLSSETKVGDLTLPAGRYRLGHRVDGSNHFIHFEGLTPGNPYFQTSSTVKGHPGEVPCRVESVGRKISQTALYTTQENGATRITKVEIAGENVAHLF